VGWQAKMNVGGGESEQLREQLHPVAPVNPEVFHDRPVIPGQVSDNTGDKRVEGKPEANLEYACAVTTETANHFLLRTSQLTPAELKVMGGVLSLGFEAGFFRHENKGQITACLQKRASEQNNPNARNGLLNMASQIDRINLV
jgi:hypothetical protein